MSTAAETSAATIWFATVKSELLSLQVTKMEEDRVIDKQNKIVDAQMHLVRQCIGFVTENPGWPKEDILALFPAFEPIIEKVFANMKKQLFRKRSLK